MGELTGLLQRGTGTKISRDTLDDDETASSVKGFATIDNVALINVWLERCYLPMSQGL